MEKERFTTIWEYASPADEVNEEDVFRVCSMYLGGAPTEEPALGNLKSAVATLLTAVGRKSDAILAQILKGDNPLTEYLSGALEKSQSKPKDSLRTILDQDLADDDEDDSSVEEVSSYRRYGALSDVEN